MAGSEIADQIERETEGEYRPGSGSLYPVLKKLHTSGFTEKLPLEDGVHRYRLTEKGNSFFEEHVDVMEEVRERLDAVEFPFTNLFQHHPQFRTYFMRISKSMMALSELSNEDWSPNLATRVEKIISKSADDLETLVNTIQKK